MKALKKILPFFSKKKEVKADIASILAEAKQKGLVNTEFFTMIEGVLQIANMRAHDVMVPKHNMIMLKDDSSYADVVAEVNCSAHSRYPVVSQQNPDEVIGIMLSKDLLLYSLDKQDEFDIKKIIRDAVMVPESKRLDALLREFRLMHNHMAIVVDEYGTVSGIVTIEDILEEIVGEIEDEHDVEEEEFRITPQENNTFFVDAHTPLDQFNQYFSTTLASDEFNTIGGIVMHQFGYLPSAKEKVEVGNLTIQVKKADSRRIYELLVEPKQSSKAESNS